MVDKNVIHTHIKKLFNFKENDTMHFLKIPYGFVVGHSKINFQQTKRNPPCCLYFMVLWCYKGVTRKRHKWCYSIMDYAGRNVALPGTVSLWCNNNKTVYRDNQLCTSIGIQSLSIRRHLILCFLIYSQSNIWIGRSQLLGLVNYN